MTDAQDMSQFSTFQVSQEIAANIADQLKSVLETIIVAPEKITVKFEDVSGDTFSSAMQTLETEFNNKGSGIEVCTNISSLAAGAAPAERTVFITPESGATEAPNGEQMAQVIARAQDLMCGP